MRLQSINQCNCNLDRAKTILILVKHILNKQRCRQRFKVQTCATQAARYSTRVPSFSGVLGKDPFVNLPRVRLRLKSVGGEWRDVF